MPHIWEREKGDNDAEWPFFVAYRDMTPRLLSRVRLAVPGTAKPPTLAQLHEWSNEFLWHERAVAYDRHMDAIRVREREAMVAFGAKEQAERQMAMWADVLDAAAIEASKLRGAALANDFATMKPEQVVKAGTEATKNMRLIAGQSTDNSQATIDIPALDKLTPEQLLALVDKLPPVTK